MLTKRLIILTIIILKYNATYNSEHHSILSIFLDKVCVLNVKRPWYCKTEGTNTAFLAKQDWKILTQSDNLGPND